MFKYDEVYAETLKYFGGDVVATSSCINKYLLRSGKDMFLEKSPDDIINRLVLEFVRIENKFPNPLAESDIRGVFDHFKFGIAQGSPIFGIGNNSQMSSLGNCFVVASPIDNYSSIIQRDEDLVNIMKRRGGCGIDLSNLRPSGAEVNNSARTSDGICCFMERYSNTTKEVAQNGRRGALMITVDCRHPDIERFIMIKRDTTRVTGANISIKWSDEFLKCIKDDSEFTLRFPVDAKLEDAKITRKVKAKDIWKMFIRSNWESGEPGCLFWDRIISQSLSDLYPQFKTISTNPCGEIPLSEYGACILMCVNLKHLVEKPFTPDAKFMTSLFTKNLKIMSRLIDDLLELEIEKIEAVIAKIKKDPEPMDVKKRELELWEKILGTYRSGRRVGLGVTGLADLMAKLGIKYDSQDALAFAENLFKAFHMTLMHENATLAQERGKFPLWDWEKEKDSHYIRILPHSTQEHIKKHGRRNISMTTVAPAGTISIMAQCSSGIEPVFKREYVRKRKMNPGELERGIKPDKTDADGTKWVSYDVYHHGLEEWKALYPDRKVEESPYWKCQADELDWKFRIKLQGVIQKYITHSISSTCNLAKDISEDEISKIYLMAWEEGLKGVTIYREGTREGVMIEKENDERPKEVEHDIHYSNVEGHQWIFFVGSVKGKVYEIFGGRNSKIEIPKKFKKGWIVKDGKDSAGRRMYDLYLGTLADSDERMIIKDIASEFSNSAGSYTRLISLMLKSKDTPLHVICEQLNKDTTSHMFAFEKCVARVLKKYIKDGIRTKDVCDQCKGETFEYRDGCKYCVSCGNGKCG